MPEGRQSPPPERQTGAQQRDPPGSGQRTGNTEKGKSGKSQLEGLTSNPKGAMDDTLDSKFEKAPRK
ncbi:hypothetical protein ACO1O0_001783 [Amphichorda felina]